MQSHHNSDLFSSIFLFFMAGLCEIGGGYIVWVWVRDDMGWIYGILGGFILFVYGVIPTFQNSPNFHRIYAAYGGYFIVMSLLWGWFFDGVQPDRYDIIGGSVALIGIGIIYYVPRGGKTIRS
ncbi:MAG: YnfA family protein [Nitrososphaeraceae archaeon]|nr:YnfA family protein [Nitrososphaeraceae archaeon]